MNKIYEERICKYCKKEICNKEICNKVIIEGKKGDVLVYKCPFYERDNKKEVK